MLNEKLKLPDEIVETLERPRTLAEAAARRRKNLVERVMRRHPELSEEEALAVLETLGAL